MKAITLVKSFTVVLIFLAGVVAQAVNAPERTKEQCRLDVTTRERNNPANESNCKAPEVTDTPAGKEQKYPTPGAVADCIQRKLKEAIDDECSDLLSQKEINGTCDSKFDAYQSKLETTNEECGKANGGNLVSCTAAANACGLAASSVDDGAGLSGLLGQLMGGGSGGGSSGGTCTLQDDTLEDRKSAIDDQIQRLEDDKVDSVTKQAELDDDLNKKKTEVNEKVSDLEAEFRKADTEKKTQSQQEAADLQKKILASNKTIRDNLAKVADKNVEIANLSFGIQQIMIESSNLAVNKTCTDKYNAGFNAAYAIVTGPDGKKTKPKYTMKENSKIKADLRLIQSQCLQAEGLKRDAQLKGIADKRRLLLVEVDTYMKSNEDEQKSIGLDRKALDDKEKLLAEDQKKALDEKNKKLDDLSKSVADFADVVARKKKALDAKIANRDKQIATLVTKKANLKPKFSGVASSIQNSRSSAKAYLRACCKGSGSTVTKDHTGCSQVRTDSGSSTGFGSTSADTTK